MKENRGGTGGTGGTGGLGAATESGGLTQQKPGAHAPRGGTAAAAATAYSADDAASVAAAEDLRLGSCPCGALVCVRCHGAHKLADGQHICPDLKTLLDDTASSKLIASIGKKCPACGLLAQKDGGCDLMMCGTAAHGKVADALQNGGCAYIFSWNTLRGCSDGHGYTNLEGKWTQGKGPKTDRQVLL